MISKVFHGKKALPHQHGQIMSLVLIVLATVFISTLIIISGAKLYASNSTYGVNVEKASALAEAGVDKAIVSLNKTAGIYNGESETVLGDGSYSVSIADKNASTKIVTSTGYFPNKTKPKTKRTVTIEVSKGVGISFVYGMLIGNGGVHMENGSRINGSIYSNGNIVGGNNEIITGDAFVAAGTQPNADQQTDCTTCQDFIFGKTVSGNSQLDVAQSFKPNTSAVINKVSLKLKKFGSPPNLTVRIVGDSSGKPNKSNVLTSGTLSANLVTGQYGFVDVAFSSTPNLTSNTTYWILIDTSSDNSNYWAWSNDLDRGYNRGSPAWSPNWQASNPTWNNVSGDFGFKTWMGGVATSIVMNNGSVVQGNVHANTISGLTINKDAYYQIINNTTVVGTSHPNSEDPVPIAMPISEANIAEWKTDAQNRGVTTGNVTGCPSQLGPGKIVGNINLSNNCNVTVTTPIWVTGTVSLGNAVILRMNPSLGSSSGVIIVDGITTFTNSDDLLGTGVAGSYLTLLSTYDSQASGLDAINTGNSSITGILYAPYGIITLANNATFKEVVAWQINTGTNTTLTYDSGLISTFFSAGPSGSFTPVKGTYQIK